jgi:predicted transcriptional regulator
MTLAEIVALEAIASGSPVGLRTEIVEKLREGGLVFGEQGTATLSLTKNGLSILENYRRSLNRFS